MRDIPRSAIEAISRHDREIYGRPMKPLMHALCGEPYAAPERPANRTRFYKWIVLRGFDAAVHTVAVKNDRFGSPMVKEVVRGSVFDKKLHVRDLVFYYGPGGYSVDWHREGIGHKKEWSYDAGWESDDYTFRGSKWKLDCPVLNLEALQGSKRFRWCAWSPSCGDLLDYLKLYARAPRVELLVKCGLGRLARARQFVLRLARDKGLMQFLSRHMDEVKGGHHLASEILMAYCRKITLDEARTRLWATRQFAKASGLDKAADPVRADQYVSGQRGATKWEYCEYLRRCRKLGFDMADTKTLYPRDFHKRWQEVGKNIDEFHEREQAELRAKLDSDLAVAASRWSGLQVSDGVLEAVLPGALDDFIREGEKLQHCVGSGYPEKVQSGDSLVIFVRRAERKEEPFVTVELNLRRGVSVSQVYGFKNSKPDARVIEFVEQRLLASAKRTQKALIRKAG